LGSGTTFYNTGTVETIRHSTTETLFAKYSATLYDNLQKEGHDLSKILFLVSKKIFIYSFKILLKLKEYSRVGSIGLATSRDRWHTVKRLVSETKAQGIECFLLSAEECQEKFPLLRVDDVEVNTFKI